jgi:dihydrofolate synthase/folylpolyglutamate synthase
LDESFAEAPSRVVVLGLLQGRDPDEMIAALGPDQVRVLVACTAPSPRAMPASEVADAAGRAGIEAVEVDDVGEAVAWAVDAAGPEELVLVTGSLYVVGAARTALRSG